MYQKKVQKPNRATNEAYRRKEARRQRLRQQKLKRLLDARLNARWMRYASVCLIFLSSFYLLFLSFCLAVPAALLFVDIFAETPYGLHYLSKFASQKCASLLIFSLFVCEEGMYEMCGVACVPVWGWYKMHMESMTTQISPNTPPLWPPAVAR